MRGARHRLERLASRPAGDTGGYVLAGSLLLQLGGRAWHELGPGDGFYLPGGERYQVASAAGGITSYLTGSAPPPALAPAGQDSGDSQGSARGQDSGGGGGHVR